MKLLQYSPFLCAFGISFCLANEGEWDMPQNSTIVPSSSNMSLPEIEGSFKLGYGSRYEYRGLVLSNDVASQGGLVFEGDLVYAADVIASPMMSLTYRDMSLYDCDQQINFVAGFQGNVPSPKENVQSMVKFGYQLISGGLPGLMREVKRGGDLTQYSGSIVQEFVLGYTPYVTTDWGNYFSSYTLSYAFYGLQGWTMSFSLGYEYPITERVAVTLSGTVNWSFSYWTSEQGADSANVLLTVPITIKENSLVSPFIMTDWGARNAKMINSHSGYRLVDNFAVIAGVRYMWTF